MATPRMDITSFVGKLLEQDDVDALREGVKVLAQAVMETEGLRADRRSTLRTELRTNRLPQRLPHSSVGHQGRHDRAQDPQGDRGRLLPLAP
jgi:hypothetical protein